jgi:hypothetical protein
MKRNVIVKIAGLLLVAFLLMQLIRPQKNTGAAETPQDITHFVTVPDTVMGLLKTSCYDCHSNNTHYPWYAEIAPASLWLAHHIKKGKEELNFSDFSQYNRRRIKNKLNSIGEQVENRDMPLKSYLWLHRAARLSDADIKRITDWVEKAKTEVDQLKP